MKKIILMVAITATAVFANPNINLNGVEDFKEALKIIEQLNEIQSKEEKRQLELSQKRATEQSRPKSPHEEKREKELKEQEKDTKTLVNKMLDATNKILNNKKLTYILPNVKVIEIGEPAIIVNRQEMMMGLRQLNALINLKQRLKKVSSQLKIAKNLSSTQEINKILNTIQTQLLNIENLEIQQSQMMQNSGGAMVGPNQINTYTYLSGDYVTERIKIKLLNRYNAQLFHEE